MSNSEEKEKIIKITEKDLEFRLSERFCQPEWAFFGQVRNSTGFASRVADGIAMNMFPSRGHEINGFEIKILRSDWLLELKNPSKADEIFSYCDKFWLVISDKNIVQNGELPKGWGLMILQGSRLIAKVQAERKKAKTINSGFVASLLRNATDRLIPEDTIRQRINDSWRGGKESRDWEVKKEKENADRYKDLIERFEKESGTRITSWYGSETPEKVGNVLKRFFAGEDFEKSIKYDLGSAKQNLENALEKIKAFEK